MSKPISCGIIGCGVIAPLHAKCYSQIDDVSIQWACDLQLEKAETLSGTFDIPNLTTDYHEVLRDPTVDVISICTDHASHAQIAIDAMRAGKHVLCEKALAAHPQALDSMLKEAHKHPELACAGIFQHRFNSRNRYLSSLVKDGFFGTVLSASLQVHCLRTAEYYESATWRGTMDLEGGGVLINQAIHFIDAMVFVLGPVSELSAKVENRTHGDIIDVEDNAVATFQFENGSLGIMEANSSCEHRKWANRLIITGTDAMVEMCNESLNAITCVSEESAQKVRETFAGLEGNRPLAEGKSYYGSGHAGQIRDFIAAVRSGSQPEVTLESAAHAVRVVHAIYKASQSKRWEPVSN
jgi:UDP-N-acetyl-2-amino-2-deoxyglucuronate dehydrogenase